MPKKTENSKKKPVARRAPRKRYTPRQQQVIQDLADVLGKLVPATSQGSFSLQRIAKDRGLGAYFNERLSSKKKQFEYFISKVHKDKPRTLKPFIADLLATAVEKRRQKGNPMLRPEADLLKGKLLEFGIDLATEIDELQLPSSRPHITPPPVVTLQALDRIGLHPLLIEKVLPLFKEGHINEAVRKAAEILEAMVRRASGLTLYGRPLMAKAFDRENPVIDVAGYHGSEAGNVGDEREGFMLIAMGAMQWCKNLVGHDDIPQVQPHDGASRVALISHLMEVVQVAVDRRPD